jgi:hypothetical protein
MALGRGGGKKRVFRVAGQLLEGLRRFRAINPRSLLE